MYVNSFTNTRVACARIPRLPSGGNPEAGPAASRSALAACGLVPGQPPAACAAAPAVAPFEAGDTRLYLSGLIHRDRLFDIACRWLADRADARDGRTLTEIFVFEHAITAPSVRSLVTDLAQIVQPGRLLLRRATTKDAVRDAIVAAVADPTPRVRELVELYRERPEEFFPRTPVHMSLITDSGSLLVGMVRRKRIRRIADKVSRRVADQLASEIDRSARGFAERRARRAGVPLERMVSTRSEMVADFVAAERQVADRIRLGTLTLDPRQQEVDDLIGVKLVVDQGLIPRLEEALERRRRTWIFRRKVHEGPYGGIHYLVDLELPPTEAVIDSLRSVDWSFAAGRGVAVADLERDLREYLASGSRTFRLELILTSLGDLVESEFGSSIHEVRILEQRGRASYFGRIAINASWIIEYMLHLAISPSVTVGELPIKIWGRYLRDTLSHAIACLGNGESAEWVVPGEPDEVPLVPAGPGASS